MIGILLSFRAKSRNLWLYLCMPEYREMLAASLDNRSFFPVEVIRFPTLDDDAVSR